MANRGKRPSVKGMGADIFFGDGDPTPDELTPQRDAAPEPGAQASMHASMQASTPEAEAPSPQPSDLDLLIFEAALVRLSAAATITSSFRFTKPELDALHDATYRVRKRHGLQLAKQDIVRLGLAALLAEYKERGGESVLGRFISQKQAS